MQAPFTFSYGWEWLTCEAGFLAIFLCSPPVFSLKHGLNGEKTSEDEDVEWREKEHRERAIKNGSGESEEEDGDGGSRDGTAGSEGGDGVEEFQSRTYTFFPSLDASPYVIGLFRLLAFRLLIGAGMSKVGRNSSKCWRELTCTTTHYFTQPIPNPASWYFHFLPHWIHQVEVAMTFFEQLCVPFLMLVPHANVRRFAGCVEIVFQLLIVGTGNYAWINFVGCLPCLALFDDAFVESCEGWFETLISGPIRWILENFLLGPILWILDTFWSTLTLPVWGPVWLISGGGSAAETQEKASVVKTEEKKIKKCKNAGTEGAGTGEVELMPVKPSEKAGNSARKRKNKGKKPVSEVDDEEEDTESTKTSSPQVSKVSGSGESPTGEGDGSPDNDDSEISTTFDDEVSESQSLSVSSRSVARRSNSKNRNGRSLTSTNSGAGALSKSSSSSSLLVRVIDGVLLMPLRLLTYFLYRGSIMGLFCFMIYKIKDPLFELFSPAPWINQYDDWFFTTSQGVFGFINRLRINLVLEYRHDKAEITRTAADLGVDNSLTGETLEGLSEWRPLDFKSIPGSIDRLPSMLSPYHSRLDWETWIRTTASFEHTVQQYPRNVLGQALQQNIPDFIRTLVEKILSGDENAARLTGADLGDLYYPLNAKLGAREAGKVLPTEIRSRFFLYEFQERPYKEEEVHWVGRLINWVLSEVFAEHFLVGNPAVRGVAGAVGVPKNGKWSLENISASVKELGQALAGFTQPGGNWYKREALDQPGQEQVFNRPQAKKLPYQSSHPARHWVMGLSIFLMAISTPVIGGKVRRYYSGDRENNRGPSVLSRFTSFTAQVILQVLLLGIFCLALFSDYSDATRGGKSKKSNPGNWLEWATWGGESLGNYGHTAVKHDVVSMHPKRVAKTVFPGLFYQVIAVYGGGVLEKILSVFGAQGLMLYLGEWKNYVALHSEDSFQSVYADRVQGLWSGVVVPFLGFFDSTLLPLYKPWCRILAGVAVLLVILSCILVDLRPACNSTKRSKNRTLFLGFLRLGTALLLLQYALLLNRGVWETNAHSGGIQWSHSPFQGKDMLVHSVTSEIKALSGLGESAKDDYVSIKHLASSVMKGVGVGVGGKEEL